MKILTDDPDWKRDLYEARALAVAFVGRYGRTVPGGRQAAGNGLTVTYHPDQSPMQLTIDAADDRVLSVAWKPGDAWRMEIETYHSGRWQSRLKAAAHPRPWLERWRAVVTFTGSLPKPRLPEPGGPNQAELSAGAPNRATERLRRKRLGATRSVVPNSAE